MKETYERKLKIFSFEEKQNLKKKETKFKEKSKFYQKNGSVSS